MDMEQILTIFYQQLKNKHLLILKNSKKDFAAGCQNIARKQTAKM